MADERNYAALEWVIGEIEETLKEAQKALEAFVETPEDSTRIRFCLTHIHQVHGSLRMVEFSGAALLAEEMEGLAQALMDRQVSQQAEGLDVLMRAILQLPIYLERAKVARRDEPATILPLLNDLRAVRGMRLLSETRLFTPDLSAAKQVQGTPAAVLDNKAQLSSMLEKLRQMYQYAAAGYIRSVNPTENLAYLNKVFARMGRLTEGTARYPLWEIVTAVGEVLSEGSLGASVALKQLLRQLDKEIKQLAVGGRPAFDGFNSEALTKNFLYYLCVSDSNRPQVVALRERYGVSQALVDGAFGASHRSLMDAETMEKVVDALKDELETVKHALDMGMSGSDHTAVADALPVMQRVADTLEIIGIADLREQVLAQITSLQTYQSGDEPPHDLLMAIASEMIAMEQRLTALTAAASRSVIGGSNADRGARIEIGHAQETVLREARTDLEKAKDAIIEFIASQWDVQHLHSVPVLLNAARGGLSMVPLARPSAILQSCGQYIQQELIDKGLAPDWQQLDTLADAIASVEYYLERLGGDADEDDEALMGMAEASVASLGYPVAGYAATASAAARRDGPQADAESVLQKMGPVDAVEMGALPQASEPLEEAVPDEPIMEDGEEDASTLEWTPTEGAAIEDAVIEDVVIEDVVIEAPCIEASEIEESGIETVATEAAVENVLDDGPVRLEAAQTRSASESEADSEEAVDPEILAIFVEEAGEVLDTIDTHFPTWAQDFDDMDALTEFRRAFHTLKGSGRMVKAHDISELAWAIENMLNRVMDRTIEPHSAQTNLITQVRALLPALIGSFEAGEVTPHSDQIAQYCSWAEALAAGELPAELIPKHEPLSPALVSAPVAEVPAICEDQDTSAEEDEERDVLWRIFASEAETHLHTVGQFIAAMDKAAPLFLPPSESLQRALHTLKGSAHMADVGEVAQLATPLERFVKELRTYLVNIDADILQLLKDAVSYIEAVVEQIRAGEALSIPRLEQFVARVAELKDRSVGPMIRQREQAEAGSKRVDPELLSIFMAEAMDLLLDVDQLLDQWQANPDDTEQLAPLIDELHTLADGAEHAQLPQMEQLSRALEAVYRSTGGQLQVLMESDFGLLQAAHETLLDQVDAVAAGQNLTPLDEATLARLRTLAENFAERESDREAVQALPQAAQELAGDLIAAEDFDELVGVSIELDSEGVPLTSDFIPTEIIEADAVGAVDAVDTESASEPEVSPEPHAEALSGEVVLAPVHEDLDPEIVEIFTEEADELMEEIEQLVADWALDRTLTEPQTELKRALHTLKGGARLAGMLGLGDIAHNFETYLIELDDHRALNDEVFRTIHRYQDQLLRGVESVKAFAAGQEVDLTGVLAIEAMPELDTGSALSGSEAADTVADPAGEAAGEAASARAPDPLTTTAKVVPFTPKDNIPVVSGGAPGPAFSVPAPLKGGATQGATALATKRSAPQEIVKVSAELLEELVNLAGETSISRGRTEEQISEMGFTLEDMDATIVRLQEQLRRLDIETEAQVLFRQEQMAESDDFDPLEMDRYTQLQQLSRSLIESASDLLDLKTTLADKARDTETLLLQQSRINTELQEGLMRSRMVQFSRLVPRLRRIVRQVATELDKKVDFELNNVEGEMDRTVLERMVAPLEHMLRNAVDHGIETPAEREAAGKRKSGRIVLSLSREGGDVMLRLVDDGRGIRLDKVRRKAVERGLINEDANLSDRDIMQFILHEGFSTADTVTQISGRGVGLDVVNAEIKQLGGAVSINSAEGEGTEFTVRLPFTVSVNRALMVRIGDDRYAIPLNTIEGIVRVSPFELEHYYQHPESRFEYAGERYQVRYLGQMLHAEVHPKLEGQAMPLPVVLVRSPQHTVAIQVDMLMGSREIVVKSLGAQFKQVQGLSGATVMGDGSVVVILDPHALIRKELALSYDPETLLAAPLSDNEEGVKTVMVVDDSVTVRKVTSRFLEREGFEVLTAKDGADALLLLQDRIPDIMLLDIEMPRMDGFEVAKNIRSSSRWKHIPIIMITSRTGEKHRQHALSLGVDRYMGKPYQEEALLEGIQALLAPRPD